MCEWVERIPADFWTRASRLSSLHVKKSKAGLSR
jgi:hypothetical protein